MHQWQVFGSLITILQSAVDSIWGNSLLVSNLIDMFCHGLPLRRMQ